MTFHDNISNGAEFNHQAKGFRTNNLKGYRRKMVAVNKDENSTVWSSTLPVLFMLITLSLAVSLAAIAIIQAQKLRRSRNRRVQHNSDGYNSVLSRVI
ncbi:hypothetical protein GJ496_002920 [Pomphorhynchus laevis]|nr:hypothetical protein GJ496_002920 [Pomphorhynchus laevis]